MSNHTDEIIDLNTEFFLTRKQQTVNLNSGEIILRKKITFFISAGVFLLAASVSIFFIYGVIASPTIAAWLEPLSENILRAISLSSTTIAGAGFTAALISGYSFFNTEKHSDNTNETKENDQIPAQKS